ncbi:MAG: hypothetical protein ACRD19_00300 [Terriglobia bacterium]
MRENHMSACRGVALRRDCRLMRIDQKSKRSKASSIAQYEFRRLISLRWGHIKRSASFARDQHQFE